MESRFAGATLRAAPVAAAVGAAWSIWYLFDAFIPNSGSSLLEIVMGQSYSINGDNAAVALFVVVSRFILGFGISWLVVASILYGTSGE